MPRMLSASTTVMPFSMRTVFSLARSAPPGFLAAFCSAFW